MTDARVTRAFAEVLAKATPINEARATRFVAEVLAKFIPPTETQATRIVAEVLVKSDVVPALRVTRNFVEVMVTEDIPDALAEITDNNNATLTIISRAGRTASLALHHSIDTTFGYQTVKLDRWNESVAHAYCFRGYYGVYIFDGYIN